jgi:eukaryotic-like serine/threonine-protein kinase
MRAPHLLFGPYIFDPNSRMLSRAGVELQLPPRVIGVLEVLLRRAGDVVPRQDLIEGVWKDAFVTDTSLAEAVSALRQALGDDPQTPTYVQTLHRRGYRFVAPVAEGAAEPFAGPSAASRGPAPEIVAPSIAGQLMPWSLAAVCAVLAVVAVWQVASGRRSVEPLVARFAIPLPDGTHLDGRASALAISPDAATASWSGCSVETCRLYIRRLDRLQPEPVPGTEGAAAPFFSPDGRWVAFFADGKLKKVSLAGGAPVTLGDAPDPLGGVWTAQREIVYAGSATGGLVSVAENGGDPKPVTEPRASDGEVAHVWPALAPGGDVLLFTILRAPGSVQGQLGARAVNAFGPTTDGWRRLATGIAASAGAMENVVLFSRGGELQATWFDGPRLSIAGPPPLVVSPVARGTTGSQFAVSASGALLVAEPADSSAAGSLRWLAGKDEIAVPDLDRSLQVTSVSADGARAAGVEEDGSRSDIWVADLVRGTTTRVTHGGQNTAPVWSGRNLFYASRNGGTYDIWKKDVDTAAPPLTVHGGSRPVFPVASAADGSSLAFLQVGGATRADLWLLPLAGGSPAPLVESAYEDGGATFSPDGGMVAYQSNEAGRWDVYVLRRSDGKRGVVSRAGGAHPVWAPDGAWLLYENNRELLRVAFEGKAGEFRIGAPERVAALGDGRLIGIDASGRILIRRPPPQPTSLVLVLQWLKELADRLGPPPAFVPR